MCVEGEDGGGVAVVAEGEGSGLCIAVCGDCADLLLMGGDGGGCIIDKGSMMEALECWDWGFRELGGSGKDSGCHCWGDGGGGVEMGDCGDGVERFELGAMTLGGPRFWWGYVHTTF